jgi:hypothetical protein
VAEKITGGSPFGQGDAQVNVTRAVLLDECTVVLIGTATWGQGAGRAIGVAGQGQRFVDRVMARLDAMPKDPHPRS